MRVRCFVRHMRRFLHTFPEAPELAGRNIIHATPIVDPRVPQVPNFRVMGQGTMLQVQLPPSITLVAKRNALTGLLGPSAVGSRVTSRISFARNVFNRLWGRQPVVTQKIVSTSPTTCLLGSQNRYLSALELNGSMDWVIRAPILASCGKQLYQKAKSGFGIRSAAPFAHTVVSGRGWLCLSTPASPVQITVGEGEQILVAKAHLNAYSVDTNAAYRTPKLTNVNFEFPTLQSTNDSIKHDSSVTPDFAANTNVTPESKWKALLSSTVVEVKKYYKYTRELLRKFTLMGNTNQFVEIYGPATVLVSSASRPPKVKASDAK